MLFIFTTENLWLLRNKVSNPLQNLSTKIPWKSFLRIIQTYASIHPALYNTPTFARIQFLPPCRVVRYPEFRTWTYADAVHLLILAEIGKKQSNYTPTYVISNQRYLPWARNLYPSAENPDTLKNKTTTLQLPTKNAL